MDAFGNVEPIRIAAASTSDTTSTPDAPVTPTQPAQPITPTRSSSRIRHMHDQSPTPFQIQRMEQAELSKGRVRSSSSPSSTPSTPKRAPSAPRSLRSNNPIFRTGNSVKPTKSPHENDQDDEDEGQQTSASADGDDNGDEDYVDEEYVQSNDEDSVNQQQVSTRDPPCIVKVTEPWFAPPLQEFHTDWNAWKEYLVTYMRETHQVLVIYEVINIHRRNQALEGMISPPEPYLTKDMDKYERIYVCTHGPRPKSRKKKSTEEKEEVTSKKTKSAKKEKKDGKKEKEQVTPLTSKKTKSAKKEKKDRPRGEKPAKRAFRFIRHTDCPFRIRVQWCHSAEHQWRLRVKVSCLWHNHRVGAQVYDTYPISRGIKNPENLKRAHEMVNDGQKPAAVYDEMLQRGENVIQSDINNVVYSIRQLAGDDNGAVTAKLKQLRLDDPEAVITTDPNIYGETGVISITTKHHRDMFARFAQLLLVDCTHKTNKYNYQLCTVMVMDEFGNGQVVQQSLLETNGDWHMTKVLDHLKRANPDTYKLVRVIVVDKDMNEVKVLERAFPEAKVLICMFHALKYLSAVKHKVEFGKLSADDHTVMDNHVHRLVYAESEEEFNNNRVAFENACERLQFTQFAEYMRRNWFTCTDMWVMWERSKLPHYKNHTNNRLENWFGKFKDGVTPHSTMAHCVEALLKESRRCVKEYNQEFFREGRFYNADYTGNLSEMNDVLLCSTPFVAKILEPEFRAALNKFESYSYQVDEKNQSVIITSTKNMYSVSLIDCACDCEHALSMLLPCRHAMAYRKFKNQGSVIPLQRFDMRWKRHSITLPPITPYVVVNDVPRVRNASNPSGVFDSKERYRRAMGRAQTICSELAEVQDEGQFNDYMTSMEILHRYIRKRKRVEFVDDEDQPDSIRAKLSSVDEAEDVGMRGQDDQEQQVQVDQEQQLDLSQANSLYSADVGDVPHPDLNTLIISPPSDLFVSNPSQAKPDENLPIPGEDLSSSGENKATPSSNPVCNVTNNVDLTVAREQGPDIVINLNQNVPRTGRPRNVRAEIQSGIRNERARFNRAQRQRDLSGEVTMDDVLDNLDEEQPGLEATSQRLSGIKEKYTEYANNKPKFYRKKDPTLNVDCYYILPPKLLQAAHAAFPVSTRPGETINVGTPVGTPDVSGPRRRSPRGPKKTVANTDLVECIQINSVGWFSRAQIETMRRAENLIKQVKDAHEMVEWLHTTLHDILPDEVQPAAIRCADRISSVYPGGVIDCGAGDIEVQALFRLQPDVWLNDTIIIAFFTRLQQLSPDFKFAGVIEQLEPKRGSSPPVISQVIYDRTRDIVNEDGTTHVILPVNFANSHWTCLWVDMKARQVNWYDSLTGPKHKKALETLASHLINTVDSPCKGFAINGITTPKQSDGDNCGVFVCLKVWLEADRTVSPKVDQDDLARLRFEILHLILFGDRCYVEI